MGQFHNKPCLMTGMRISTKLIKTDSKWKKPYATCWPSSDCLVRRVTVALRAQPCPPQRNPISCFRTVKDFRAPNDGQLWFMPNNFDCFLLLDRCLWLVGGMVHHPSGVKVVFTPDDLSVAAPSMKAAFNGPGPWFYECSIRRLVWLVLFGSKNICYELRQLSSLGLCD